MYIVWVGMSLVWAYLMSIACSGALKGCLHPTGEGYVHSLAHYCCNGSNMTLTCILAGVQLWKRVCMVVWAAESVRYCRCMRWYMTILHERFDNLLICDTWSVYSVIPEVWYWILWHIMLKWSVIYSSYKACVWVVQDGAVKLPALTYPVRRRMDILLFKFWLFVCACLCPIDD